MGCYQSKEKLKFNEKPITFETTMSSKKSYIPQRHFRLKTIAPYIKEDTIKTIFSINILDSESIL